MLESVSRRDLLKYGAVLGGAALSAPLIAACSSSSTKSGGSGAGGKSPKTVHVYLLAPLTGVLAAEGPGQATAYQNAVKWLNDAGGIKSLGGAHLSVTVKDTESTPSVAADAVQQAAQDSNVLAVMGCNQSGASLVVAQVALQNKLPFVTSSDIDPRIAQAGKGWALQIPPQAPLYSAPIIDFIDQMSKQSGVSGTKMAILYSNGALGQACTPPAVAYAKSKGIDVAFVDSYDSSKVSDFAPYISKYQAAGVTALCGTQDPQPAILIVRAMKQLNWQPTIMAAFDGSFGNDVWMSALGNDSDYTYDANPWVFNINQFGMPSFVRTFQQRFGHAPGDVDQIAFAAISVIADALERAATTDRGKFHDALLATDLKPGEGPIPCLCFDGVKFDASGKNTRAANFVAMTKGKQNYVVAPSQYATQKAIWPRPAWSNI